MQILITNSENILYLTGYKSDNYLERHSYALATVEKGELRRVIHFIPEMFALELSGDSSVETVVLKPGQRLFTKLEKFLSSTRLYYEADHLTVAELEHFRKSRKLSFYKSHSIIEKLRARKSRQELKYVEQAVARTVEVFRQSLPAIQAGISETELVEVIGDFIAEKGCSTSFPTIVAFGENSAIPHHKPSSRKLQPGDIVLIDWGVRVENYAADLTRTFIFAGSDSGFDFIHQKLKSVFDQFTTSPDPISSTQIARMVGAATKRAGKDPIHAAGHGLGLSVHEFPYISEKADDYHFQGGEMIAVEPGYYKQGWGGVRLERNLHYDKKENKWLILDRDLPIYPRYEDYLAA